MDVICFFGLTKEKLMLFLILFYIPAIVIFTDFVSGLYSNTYLYVLIGISIVAYLVSSGLCLIGKVNEFLRPTTFKWTILALFAGISLSIGLPFFDTNVLKFGSGNLTDILRRGFTRDLLDIPSILLQFYVYAAVVEYIVKKIKKVEDIYVDWKLMVKKWWFWLIIVILIILIISQYFWTFIWTAVL